METPPDPLQEWAKFWLREQHRGLIQKEQLQLQSPQSMEFVSIALQVWQQNCALWANNLVAGLPGELVAPVVAVLKQSQDDLLGIFQTVQQRVQSTSEVSDHASDRVQLTDLATLSRDPVWCEHLKAFNAFVQIHIQFAIESLTNLKIELEKRPGQDPQQLLEKIFANDQITPHSSEYNQVLTRLIDSLTALSSQTRK